MIDLDFWKKAASCWIRYLSREEILQIDSNIGAIVQDESAHTEELGSLADTLFALADDDDLFF